MENYLIQYLDKLKEKAVKSHPTKILKDRYKCYAKGGVSETYKAEGTTTRERNVSTNNVLKSIVDTVSTFSLDNHLTKEVALKSMSFSDAQNLEMVNNKASVLNDCLQDVVDNNHDKEFQKNTVLSILIYGLGITKAYWSQDSEEELGEVKYEQLNPCHFFPDPSATGIDNCNYIFVKTTQSVFDLVQKYKSNPEMLAKIKKLTPGDTSGGKGFQSDRTNNLISTKNDTTSNMGYIDGDYDGQYKKSTENLTIWECYLKDDTVFVDPKGDHKEELEMQRFKYPNGRVITYCNKTILDDKAIDYPFGFPFDIERANYTPDSFWPDSLVEYLKYPQQRLDNLNMAIRQLIVHNINVTVIPPESGIHEEDLCVPTPIVKLEPNAFRIGALPTNYKNSNLTDLPSLEKRAEVLESDMYNIARVNKMMVSGERPVGVNSGRMVEDLIESPMTSIRELQRNIVALNVRLSNKIITLIQLYYKAQRIIRLSTGDFIQITPEFMENAEQQNTVSIQKSIINQEKVAEIAIDIKTDLSSGEFETKIIAGSEMPLSRTQLAQLTMKFGSEGFFNPVDIDVKEFILDKIDYPNYRAVIQKMRDAAQRQQESIDNDPQKQFLMDLAEAEVKPKELLSAINNITDPIMKNDATIQLLMAFGFKPLTPPVQDLHPQPLDLVQEDITQVDFG